MNAILLINSIQSTRTGRKSIKNDNRTQSVAIKYDQNNHIKTHKMGNLLYIIAVILVIGWLIGFVGFHAGGIIHILLVIALIAVILRIIQGRKVL